MYLCEAELSLSKLTTLILHCIGFFNESDLQQLIEALPSSSINTLYLHRRSRYEILHGIGRKPELTNITRRFCELLPSMKIALFM